MHTFWISNLGGANMKSNNLRKLTMLEKAWNNDVNVPPEVRRINQMATDIRTFILRSNLSPLEKRLVIDQSQQELGTSHDTYDKIFHTLGFQHHEGTDKSIELKVIKIIMVREGLLMTLKYLANESLKTNNISGGNLLQVLSQIRDSTLNYLEALILWRQSISQRSEKPPSFIWEGNNYTLKLIRDLDFLAENSLVIESLSLNPEYLYLNPLMLNNNLEDPNTWMDPYQRAALDTNGKVDDPVFESRLRLRLAERILMQEMEMGDEGYEIFITQGEAATYGENVVMGSVALEDGPAYNQYRGSAYQNKYSNRNSDRMKKDLIKSSEGFRADSRESNSSNTGVMEEPGSRESSNSFGLSSAPISSQKASRQGGSGQGIEGVAFPSQNLSFGHDFFTGHWMDSGNRTEDESYGYISDNYINGPDEVIFVENGQSIMYKRGVPSNTVYVPLYSQVEAQEVLFRDDSQAALEGAVGHNEDVQSVVSRAKSIDSVGDLDVDGLHDIMLPPKGLVLAASCCVILLYDSVTMPSNVSWSAFLRMIKKINLAEGMRCLDPLTVPKFKIVAIQPILGQLLDQDSLKSVESLNLSMDTYSSVLQIMKWVQQFTNSAIRQQTKQKEKEEAAVLPKRKVSLEPIKRKSARNPSSEITSNPSEANVAKSKRSIPKVKIDLQKVHSELWEGKEVSPLLFMVFTSTNDDGDDAEERNAESGELAFAENKRVVIKLYDSATSKEVAIHINMREYDLFLEDLCRRHSNRARQVFQPSDVNWWKKYSKEVINIHKKSSTTFQATISKKLLDALVFREIKNMKSSSRPTTGSNRQSGSSTPLIRKSSPASLQTAFPPQSPEHSKLQGASRRAKVKSDTKSKKLISEKKDDELVEKSRKTEPAKCKEDGIFESKATSESNSSFSQVQAISGDRNDQLGLISQHSVHTTATDNVTNLNNRYKDLLGKMAEQSLSDQNSSGTNNQADDFIHDLFGGAFADQYEADFDEPSTEVKSTFHKEVVGSQHLRGNFVADAEVAKDDPKRAQLSLKSVMTNDSSAKYSKEKSDAPMLETDDEINDWIDDDGSEEAQCSIDEAISRSFSTKMTGSFISIHPSSASRRDPSFLSIEQVKEE